MSTVTITLNHGGADLILEVDYDFEPGQPETPPSYASGGEPAVGPSVSINSVLCIDIDEDDGLAPQAAPFESLRNTRIGEIIGEMCWEAKRREIIDKTFEAACEEERDDAPDPDMLRERQQEIREMQRDYSVPPDID